MSVHVEHGANYTCFMLGKIPNCIDIQLDFAPKYALREQFFGRTRTPFMGNLRKEMLRKHMRKNNKQINFRVSEKDYNHIKNQAEKSNCTITSFLLYSALNKNIYVVNGLEDATKELAKMGNNLNQLTRLCHQGIITCLDLEEVKGQVKNIWRLLNLLTPSQL